jgi:hypothetical protein
MKVSLMTRDKPQTKEEMLAWMRYVGIQEGINLMGLTETEDEARAWMESLGIFP